MKKLVLWTIAALFLMIGVPGLTTYAGSAGMVICILLFYVINPVFSLVCGWFAGKNFKQLWTLPIISAILYLTGTWLFLEMGEPAFVLYCICYLGIGIITMVISAVLNNKSNRGK